MTDNRIFNEWDGFVTTHPLLQRFFAGNSEDFAKTSFEYLSHRLGLVTQIEALNLESPEEWRISEMASGRLKMSLVTFLLELVGAKRVLEIGTFIGLSSMLMAQALGENCKIVTIEVSSRYSDMARRNITRNQLQSRVEVLNGDAIEIIASLPPGTSFDAVFIDGDKERYKEYVALAIKLVRPRGLILLDDAFFHGDLFNPKATTLKGGGVKRAIDLACESKDLRTTFIPITNGLLLACRL